MKLFYPKGSKDKPSVLKISIYSVSIFVILIVLGMIGTYFENLG